MTARDLLIKVIGRILNVLVWIAPSLTGKIAFQLFCTPGTPNITTKDRSFLDTSDVQELFDAPSGKIKSYVWNKNGARKILLLHGWASSSARWRNVIKLLAAENYRVITIDAPAHGDSSGKRFTMLKYAEAIDSAIKKFEPSILIGHSIGAASVAYYLTHFQSKQYEKLVFLAPASELGTMIGRFADMFKLSVRMRRAIEVYFENKYQKKVAYFSSKDFVKSIRSKALIIHDTNDLIVPFEQGVQVSENFGGEAELMKTSRFGHSLQHRSVYARIVDFVRS